MNTTNKKVAIIGGGASGMMCALSAKNQNPDLEITIFEKNEKLGKKILASGNGRCNIINTSFDHTNYIGSDSSFINKVFEQFSFKKFQEFCYQIGLVLDIKEDGKCYPLNNEAKSVVSLFEKALEKNSVDIKCNHEVQSIEQKEENFYIDGEPFDVVVISSGLGAASQLGSSEDGLAFAQILQHEVIETYPALVGLEVSGDKHKSFFGVKTFAIVQLFIDGKMIEEVSGDILFTKYGVSGFTILDISSIASKALKNSQKVSININLLPQFERKEILSLLKKVDNDLTSLIPLKLIPLIIDPSIKKMVHNLQNFEFEICDTHGFKHAEASGGGVKTDQINPNSMQSKKIKNLYFIGEVLDVVGQRGGYNFAFAWASGYKAGKNLAL